MNADKALMVIDVQVGMFDESDPVYVGDNLLNTIKTLISNARQKGVTVIYVQHNGEPGDLLEPRTAGWAIHPELSRIEGDVIIPKNTPDAFHQTKLHQILLDKGINRLFLAGIQTEVCVDTTCRRAFSMGYNVNLIQDAHSTWNRGELTARQIIAHHNDTLRWFAEVEESANIVF